MDTTFDHARTANTLVQSTTLLQTLLAKSVDMITVSDRSGRITYASPATERVSGYTVAEFVAGHPFENIHPEDRPLYEAAFARLAARPGLSIDLQHRIRHKDGSWRWVEGTFTSLFDDPTVNGLLATVRDITERKRTEDALRDSERKYRTLFESINDGFCIAELLYDEHGRPFDYFLIEVSPSFEKQTGIADAAGKTARQHDPHIEAGFLEHFHQAVVTGKPVRFEIRNDLYNLWVKISAFPFGEPGTRQFAVVFTNINERKQAEDAVRVSEQRFRTLFESIDEGFCLVEVLLDDTGRPADYRFLETNAVFEQQTGLQNATGKTALELVPQLERWWIETYGKVALTGESVRFENGSEPMNRWFDVYASRVGDDTSLTVAIVFNDVTERKQAEKLLRQSEERFRAVADLVPDLLWSNDATGLSDWYNRRWLDYTGQTIEQAKGYGWLAVIHPDDRERSRQTFKAAFERGEPLRREHRIRGTDGAFRWFLVQARPVYDEAGLIVRWYGAATDIHEERIALAAEQAARAEAETALKTRDQFLSIASHELRTPLTALMGYTQMLTRADTRSNTDRARMTGIIARQAQRLNTLMSQLLDVSRLQQGQFALELRPLDVVAVVAQLVGDFRDTLPPDTAHQVELLHPDEPIIIHGDAPRLEQVLQNLLSNAVKYSSEGGPVTVRVIPTATDVLLEVADQGIGIPVDAQARVFEPFYRAGNAEAQGSSFGLGLHIVTEIVQRHGGRIEVDSTQGSGSTFRVVLPRAAR